MHKKNIIYSIILILLNFTLAVICLIFLPSEVIIQFNVSSNKVSTLPKLIAVIFPFIFGIVGACIPLIKKEDDNNTKNYRKAYLISLLGILIFILMIFANLII